MTPDHVDYPRMSISGQTLRRMEDTPAQSGVGSKGTKITYTL